MVRAAGFQPATPTSQTLKRARLDQVFAGLLRDSGALFSALWCFFGFLHRAPATKLLKINDVQDQTGTTVRAIMLEQVLLETTGNKQITAAARRLPAHLPKIIANIFPIFATISPSRREGQKNATETKK